MKCEVKEVLSMIYWKPGEDPERFEIVFISRGVEGNLEMIRASEARFSRDRLELGDRVIPLHRIVEVRKNGQVIWRRRSS